MTALASTPPRSAAPTIRIALIGNPNTGKTTLFNRLTGTRQRVGNYPGVTVEKHAGVLRLDARSASLIDLPGAYSLAAASADERVAIDVLGGRLLDGAKPDVVVCVVDATNLMRNLFLVSQIADTGLPIVIALNMSDAAREQGLAIDAPLLSQRLGMEVVETVATRGTGIDQLKGAIERTIAKPVAATPMKWPPAVDRACDLLCDRFTYAGGETLDRCEALRILFDLDSTLPAQYGLSPQDTAEAIEDARAMLREAGLDPAAAEAILRYGMIGDLLEGVVTRPTERRMTRGETVDRILTHRVWGLIFFVAMMSLVFQSIYTLAVPVMDTIGLAINGLGVLVGGWLSSTPMLQSLVVDGVIAGVGFVLVFVPQILILFFFIALLEDTGYMARAAFLMDKLFSWCGLNGKSFVPLLSSYACAIPGVMAARAIEDRRARLVTILIAPLMSCSARLPIYVLLIGAFIQPAYGAAWAGFVLVAMHFVGLLVAIPAAYLLNRFVVRGTRIPFVMEMPPYRTPQLRDVLWRMWRGGEKFLRRAGTVIFAMSILIWVLGYFPRPPAVEQALVQEVAASRGVDEPAAAAIVADDYQGELAGRLLEQSYLGRIGKTLQPIFDPAGFDWRITVGVVASFPAREVVVATFGILYHLGDNVTDDPEPLENALRASQWSEGPRAGQPVFTPLVAIAIMVFFALCLQCGSTMAVMAREANWGWAIFAFAYMTALAWIAAVAVYQIGGAVFGTGGS